MLKTLITVGVATVLLVSANQILQKFPIQIHPHSFINGVAKYQVFALAVAVLVVGVTLWFNPASKVFLGLGQIGVRAEKEIWLGINGQSSWGLNGLQLLVFVSLATGTFMFLAVKQANSLSNFQWIFIPLAIVFSMSNALSEELIYRFGVVGGLWGQYGKITLLVLSAVLFGLPHYGGFPNGIVGVVMSGVLGYILCKATIETQGLSIAWAIHFVQDVIIFIGLMLMNVR